MALKLLIILLFSFSVATSAKNEWTVSPLRQYTLRDGLSQMQVTSLFQDSRGYIWIGTKVGLNRFDGEKFTTYTEKDGLDNLFIKNIFEDYSGVIWVITRDGMSSVNGKKIANYPIPHYDFQTVPTPDGKIWYLGASSDFKTMFGYFENGRYISLIEKYQELSPTTFAGIGYSAQDKSLIINTGQKIFELRNDNLKLLMVRSTDVAAIRFDQKGSAFHFYAWNFANNLEVYELHNEKVIPVAKILNGKLVGKNLAQDHHTFVNIGVRSQVFQLQPDTFEIKNFTNRYLNTCLMDRDKHLWIGTEEGLCQIYSGGFETYKREVLPMIWSITEDQRQNIWFASYSDGLFKMDGRSITNYPVGSYGAKAEWFYYQSQVDERGVLYFPNNYGILYYEGKKFGTIPNSLCYATFYDAERKLLFGSFVRRLEIYDLDHRLVRKVDEQSGLHIKSSISTFGKDRNGNLWAGGGSDLAKYNWETGKITNFNRTNGKLHSDGVVSIYTDPNGITWFGGLQGLHWYDQKNDSVRRVDKEEISETVNQICSIDSTWLVFSQPTGIYLMDLKKFKKEGKVDLTLFNSMNGFGGLEPGQNGAMKDSKGNIWMTTGTEVVKLVPKALDFHENSVNIRISGFNGSQLFYNQNNIKLPRNDRMAVIQFETICYNRPKPPLYSWKIEGSQQDWSAWQKEDYAVLTNLPDGKSVLMVKTKVPGLPNSESYVTIPLLVSLALWKQQWFFPAITGLVSLLVILSLVLLVMARSRMIRINKQAKMFQLQAILSQMNPHFVFNVMASLQSVILSANIQKANDYLVKMSNLVRGFLDASALTGHSRSKSPKNSELPLRKELDILENFIQFQQLLYPDRFDYELHLDPRIVPDKLTLPPMLIQPFVENSIKHGLLQKEGKGNLQVRIYFSKDKLLCIEIEDDGIGIQRTEELMRHSHLLYASRGKELTLKRIKLLNEMGYVIHFEILSTDKGTKIILKIKQNDE